MKKGIIIGLLLFITLTVKSQDNYNWNSGVSVSFLPITVIGTDNIGTEYQPIYENTETSGLMMNLVANFGVSIPLYATDKWSTGVRLNTGLGYQNSISNAEGLSSFVINFPNYIYYRNYRSSFDFSVLLGYQFTYTALNSHLMMLGFEYHIDDDTSLRLFGSLYNYNYFREYTNGKIEPAIEISEFGLAYIYNF